MTSVGAMKWDIVKKRVNVADMLAGLYAPHICVGCGSEGEALCVECLRELPLPSQYCYHCGVESVLGRTCRSCRGSSMLVSVNYCTPYTGVAKALVWSLKFDRLQAAAECAGAYMSERYGSFLGDDVLVVPVPTAMSRVRARGYDQSVLMARSFSRHAGLEYASLLRRLGSQEQKGASRQQRHAQLRGAFQVGRPELAADRRIILIDDVITTGATLEEAAVVLKGCGAKTVGALAFARA